MQGCFQDRLWLWANDLAAGHGGPPPLPRPRTDALSEVSCEGPATPGPGGGGGHIRSVQRWRGRSRGGGGHMSAGQGVSSGAWGSVEEGGGGCGTSGVWRARGAGGCEHMGDMWKRVAADRRHTSSTFPTKGCPFAVQTLPPLVAV